MCEDVVFPHDGSNGAEAVGHDPVVLPIHGRAGISRCLIDSVAERVVRLSPVPVLIARLRSDDPMRFRHEDTSW